MNYDEQFHYKDLRSGQLTNGIERAAHRALLYSTGLEEQDLRKPLVAIVNSFTEMVPGHEHLRGLAQDAAKGVWEAGGVPREFNTIAICDYLRRHLPGPHWYAIPPAQPRFNCRFH